MNYMVLRVKNLLTKNKEPDQKYFEEVGRRLAEDLERRILNLFNDKDPEPDLIVEVKNRYLD